MITLRDIANRINVQFPHSYTDTAVLSWVNDLEREIAEVFRHYEDTKDYTFEGHDSLEEDAQIDRPDIYVPWVISQICLANEEYDRYNNHAAIFQARYQDWREEYLREHLPVSQERFKL